MTARVVAVGIDCADPRMILQLMDRGGLPNLKRLRDRGAWADIASSRHYLDESIWTVFLTGRSQKAAGFWTSLRLRPGTYDVRDTGCYDFRSFGQFFERAGRRKVAVFDLPHSDTLWEGINGIHVLGWGAHAWPAEGRSVPPELYDRLVETHGEYSATYLQYIGLSWWDNGFLLALDRALTQGLERRKNVCLDLLRRDSWDLFMAAFPEPHNASHHFEHLTRPEHPLWPAGRPRDQNHMERVYEAFDSALGEIVEAAGEDSSVVVFSIQGHGMNSTDLPALVFVPELLFRLEFPHKGLFPRTSVESPLTPVATRLERATWPADLWERRSDRSPLALKALSPFTNRVAYPGSEPRGPQTLSKALRFPARVMEGLRRRFAQRMLGYSPAGPLWNPAFWYRRWWPEMRAFALPSYADPCVRINVKGREPHGLVEPGDFPGECDRIEAELSALKDGRTGRPVVADIWRPRESASDMDPSLPDADLVVIFDERPTDVVESPTCQRIGPFPYLRTGGLTPEGFVIASGPSVSPGSVLSPIRVVDLAPTILGLMNVKEREGLEGTDVLDREKPR